MASPVEKIPNFKKYLKTSKKLNKLLINIKKILI